MNEYSKTKSLLLQRISEENQFIQVLLGPRQIGKTTLLLDLINEFKHESIYATADDSLSLNSNWIEEQWQMAVLESDNCLLVIDEIQKIIDWPSIIKKLWDKQKRNKKTNIRLILSGSSSLSIQTGLSESLTGRFELIRAYHWGAQTSLELLQLGFADYLEFGGYPGSYRLIKNKNRWLQYLNHSIIETVIGKDILSLAQVKSPALFKQSFQLIMSYPAQVISYNKLLGQLQDKGNIDLIKYYLELFEAAFLIKCIQKYSGNELRVKGSSPKIIPLAPALINRKLFLNNEGKGRVFESLVGAELLKAGLEIYYWAEGDYEVDYVLEFENFLIAIEVKSSRNRKAKSLEIFLKKYPYAISVMINHQTFSKFEKSPKEYLQKFL